MQFVSLGAKGTVISLSKDFITLGRANCDGQDTRISRQHVAVTPAQQRDGVTVTALKPIYIQHGAAGEVQPLYNGSTQVTLAGGGCSAEQQHVSEVSACSVLDEQIKLCQLLLLACVDCMLTQKMHYCISCCSCMQAIQSTCSSLVAATQQASSCSRQPAALALAPKQQQRLEQQQQQQLAAF